MTDEVQALHPVLVVVGHVNRGKSSIVSTLAADDSVVVDDTPGTTRDARRFPMVVNGKVLYELVDTPGFERARKVLRWLEEHASQTADRPAIVARFVKEHEATGQFEQEVRLLMPVINGGAVLYIVDVSVPVDERFEAEMEILRWTGRPRMALMNRIGQADHSARWRTLLGQYFLIVREFNAYGVDFKACVDLLRSMRELDDAWRPVFDAAIVALEQQRRDNVRASALLIAQAVGEMATATEEVRLTGTESVDEPTRQRLWEKFSNHLRASERRLRKKIMGVYGHRVLKISDADLGLELNDDLFSEGTWGRLGLSRGKLAAGGATAGAITGGMLDASVGGASFFVGALAGLMVGGLAGYAGWGQMAKTQVVGQSLGGMSLQVGPITKPQFYWIVIDRALLHHRLVSTWVHGRRGSPPAPEADGKVGLVDGLSKDHRSAIARALRNLTLDRSLGEQELADVLQNIMENDERGRLA